MKHETIIKIDAWYRAYKQDPDPESIIDLFQELITNGDIQFMDEYYRDVANKLIGHGFCHRPELRVVK